MTKVVNEMSFDSDMEQKVLRVLVDRTFKGDFLISPDFFLSMHRAAYASGVAAAMQYLGNRGMVDEAALLANQVKVLTAELKKGTL